MAETAGMSREPGTGSLPTAPFIPPGQLAEREQLMNHVSVLSAANTRLQMTVAELQLQLEQQTGRAPLDKKLEQTVASFEPSVAEAELGRLNKALAQISLLAEARQAHYAAVEGERDALREERASLLSALADAEVAQDEMSRNVSSLAAELQGLDGIREEVAHLRRRERELMEQISISKRGDPVVRFIRAGDDTTGAVSPAASTPSRRAGRLTDDRLREAEASTPPPQPPVRGWWPPSANVSQEDVSRSPPPLSGRHGTSILREFEVEALTRRQDLLIEAFFEPLRDAFGAGIGWILAQQHWEEECIVLREQAAHERDQWLMEQQQAMQQQIAHREATLVAELTSHHQPGHHASSTSSPSKASLDASVANEEITQLRAELEAAKQRCIFQESNTERLQRTLDAERKRAEEKATLYRTMMERVQQNVVAMRAESHAAVAREVEEKVRQSFRNGRVYERERQASRQGDSLASTPSSRNRSHVVEPQGAGTTAPEQNPPPRDELAKSPMSTTGINDSAAAAGAALAPSTVPSVSDMSHGQLSSIGGPGARTRPASHGNNTDAAESHNLSSPPSSVSNALNSSEGSIGTAN